MIPYKKISEDRKKVLDALMREGNVVLKKHHDILKNNLSIPKCNRIKFLNLILNECKNTAVDLHVGGVFIPKQDVEKILAVKNIEWEVLCGYSKAIWKIASRHRPIDSSTSQEDLLSEATHSAIVSIYHFTKENIKFITFLQHCVNRHLTYRVGSFSHLSKRAFDLVTKYKRIKNKANGPCNFHNIVDQMDLSDKEIKILKDALSKTNNYSDLNIEDVNFMADNRENNHEEKNEDKDRINEIISSLDLSVLERSVLDGFLHSNKNSKTSMGLGTFAKNIINPVTGKPYSRQALSLAWNRVKDKISNLYSNSSKAA